MEETKRGTAMERLAALIVDRRNILFLLFLLAGVFCMISRNWVEVRDSLTDYLPENTETRQGLDLMDREFVTYATAELMVENVTYEEAERLSAEIGQIYGVSSVKFDDTEAHYTSSSALFSLTFAGEEEDDISLRALDEVRTRLSGYDIYLETDVGNPLKQIINSEMLVVDGIAVLIIILVLLLTSKTYAEIPVLLLTFGAAALLNMGTNYWFGHISFVTNSIAVVLQLALAIDYAIILCHRFQEERAQKPARDAAIAALSKAIPEISASSLTTVAGLLALTFMQFRLGYDMGTVLIKAILFSLLSVFLLMPGLLMLFSPLIDKTHHKSFVPKISFLGRLDYRTRFVVPPLFLIAFVLAFFCSNKANYVYSQYSVGTIRHNETQIAKEKIHSLFGSENLMAVLVPAGDYDKEAALLKDMAELDGVSSTLGLAGVTAMDDYTVTSSLTPRQFAELADLDYEAAKLLYAAYAADRTDYGRIVGDLDGYSVPLIDMFLYLYQEKEAGYVTLDSGTNATIDDLYARLTDARRQLRSDDWSRLLVYFDLPTEGEESFAALAALHDTVSRYYDEAYIVGDTTSCYDLRASFENDNLMISIFSVLFVMAVLLLTFRSAGLPVLLILVIQGSIFLNFSRPYLEGQNLFFLTYLIISAIQMGANIDYAIVISSRYMELKKTMPIREAMVETLNLAFPTIITSGAMLASAGIVIGFMTSNETISAIGIYLGSGTLISIFLVMCVLPQILLLGDILIEKTTFTIKTNRAVRTESGLLHIHGRVRGSLNGYLDAEVDGVFRGTLNAMVDVGTVEPQPELPPAGQTDPSDAPEAPGEEDAP